MEEIMKLDLYDLMGIEISANEKEIKSAYRKKALTCHPDKNQGNPDAAALFQQLSKALEILTDPEARASYDKVLQAKKAAKIRHRQLDSKAKRFKEDLEMRERAEKEQRDRILAEQKLEEEIKRLQEEGSRLVEEEKERIRQELIKEKAELDAAANANKVTPPTLKVTWKANKKDPSNGGYTESEVKEALERHGKVTCLIMSKKKNGSALVEFGDAKAAVSATRAELGKPENPLQLTWVSGEPKSETLEPRQYSGDKVETTIKYTDFESVVLGNLRRAAERQRLIEEMSKEDKLP